MSHYYTKSNMKAILLPNLFSHFNTIFYIKIDKVCNLILFFLIPGLNNPFFYMPTPVIQEQ